MPLCCPSDGPEVGQEGLLRVSKQCEELFLLGQEGFVALDWFYPSGKKGQLPRDRGWRWSLQFPGLGPTGFGVRESCLLLALPLTS